MEATREDADNKYFGFVAVAVAVTFARRHSAGADDSPLTQCNVAVAAAVARPGMLLTIGTNKCHQRKRPDCPS